MVSGSFVPIFPFSDFSVSKIPTLFCFDLFEFTNLFPIKYPAPPITPAEITNINTNNKRLLTLFTELSSCLLLIFLEGLGVIFFVFESSF